MPAVTFLAAEHQRLLAGYQIIPIGSRSTCARLNLTLGRL